MEQQNHILKNYKLFCSELDYVVNGYPNLSITTTNNVKVLKGILDIPDDEFKIVGNFLIEIHFTEKYPYRFPLLFEVGNSIPNEANWHKYSDGGCCITVEAEEILICKPGINLLSFIQKHAISFFANYLYKKTNGFYKNGEYGHSVIGPYQFYSNLLKTSDFKIWIQYFEYVFKELKFNDARNRLCFCGSSKKYKACHDVIFEKLKDIGEGQVLKDFKNIIK